MAAVTSISWSHSTANFWEGCTKVSTEEHGGGGCDSCYAEAMNNWLKRGANWGPGAPRLYIGTTARTVRSWQRGAKRFHAKHGCNRRVFVNSISDWLDNEVPTAWFIELLDTISRCPDIAFLLLSKRIGRWRAAIEDAISYIRGRELGGYDALVRWMEDWLNGSPPANVWIGATMVNQREYDRDISKLCAVPARIRFLSLEPLLGPIYLRNEYVPIETGRAGEWRARSKWGETTQAHWFLLGGESGRKARWCSVEWIRDLVAQGRAAGAAVFVKQLGARPTYNGITTPETRWPEGVTFGAEVDVDGRMEFQVNLKHKKGGDVAEWPEDLRVQEFPDVYTAHELAAAQERAAEFAQTIRTD